MNMQINTPTPSLRSNYVAVEGLDIGYVSRHRRHVVAERLTAHAEGGTLTCLIGRNGSGKSTLLRTVARLQPNLGGRVELGGVDTAAFSALQLARTLGVVLTSRPDASNITVGEVVAMGRAPYTGFWGRLSDADHRIVDEAMQSVGISHMSHRRVCSLSDGECQKTMIAKTLAQQTPYILLDEPTARVQSERRRVSEDDDSQDIGSADTLYITRRAYGISRFPRQGGADAVVAPPSPRAGQDHTHVDTRP